MPEDTGNKMLSSSSRRFSGSSSGAGCKKIGTHGRRRRAEGRRNGRGRELERKRGRWAQGTVGRESKKGVDGEKLLARLDGAEITARRSVECAAALPLVLHLRG